MTSKRAPGARKVSADWDVVVKWADEPGTVMDGNDSKVLVNLSSGEAKFAEFGCSP